MRSYQIRARYTVDMYKFLIALIVATIVGGGVYGLTLDDGMAACEQLHSRVTCLHTLSR
jgi:hypothetical protein